MGVLATPASKPTGPRYSPRTSTSWVWTWKRPDGSRRYRRGYIEVPKKNGKSTLFSGLSLYLLIGDGEPPTGKRKMSPRET